MPNITAYLTIGKIEAPSGFIPTHWAYLVEGARPIWNIAPAGLFSNAPICKSRWFTSPESVVDDAMAMVATVVEELPCLAAIVNSVTGHFAGEVVDLVQLSPSSRLKLDHLNRATEHWVHVVVTVLTDSIVYGQMQNFVRYPVSVEICTARYSQDGSLLKFKWRGQEKENTPPDTLSWN